MVAIPETDQFRAHATATRLPSMSRSTIAFTNNPNHPWILSRVRFGRFPKEFLARKLTANKNGKTKGQDLPIRSYHGVMFEFQAALHESIQEVR